MTELSFLIELLLNHDLPIATKKAVADRIKEVEVGLISKPIASSWTNYNPAPPIQTGAHQAPSTLALMAKHGDIPIAPPPPMPPIPVVEQVAKTPATAAALNSRNAAITTALSGVPEKGRTSPRKF